MEDFKVGDRVRVKPRSEWGIIRRPSLTLRWATLGWVRWHWRGEIGKTGEIISREPLKDASEFNVEVRFDGDFYDGHYGFASTWFHPAMLEKIEVEPLPKPDPGQPLDGGK